MRTTKNQTNTMEIQGTKAPLYVNYSPSSAQTLFDFNLTTSSPKEHKWLRINELFPRAFSYWTWTDYNGTFELNQNNFVHQELSHSSHFLKLSKGYFLPIESKKNPKDLGIFPANPIPIPPFPFPIKTQTELRFLGFQTEAKRFAARRYSHEQNDDCQGKLMFSLLPEIIFVIFPACWCPLSVPTPIYLLIHGPRLPHKIKLQ